MKLQATVVVEEKLDPALEQLLIQEMRIYAEAKADLAAAQSDVSAIEARIEAIREEAGAKKIELPGDYGITRVDGGTSSKLQKKLVYALGITKAQLDNCYKTSPKKGHTRFYLPGERAKAAAAMAARKGAPRDERDEEDYRDED
jgi:LDH2 family malate/lactate/ureidoglycolate dehydrogenase